LIKVNGNCQKKDKPRRADSVRHERRKFNRHELFRPSPSYYLLKDPLWLWCGHHAPKQEAVDETTRYDELRMQQGVEHEQHCLQTRLKGLAA